MKSKGKHDDMKEVARENNNKEALALHANLCIGVWLLSNNSTVTLHVFW